MNGLLTPWLVSTLNRLTSIVSHKGIAPPIASYSYMLGAAGNRTSVTEADGSVTNCSKVFRWASLNVNPTACGPGILTCPSDTA